MRDLRAVPSFQRLIAKERSLERFPQSGRGALRVAAAYPAPYRVGMASLGFHFLYGALRRSALFSVERVFSDTAPLTLETGSPLAGAAAVFFSISYEEDYLNAVRMLHRAGIAPLRIERGGRPLVIAGGPAVSANPAPFSAIADAIALGEGEGTLDRIAEALARWDARSPETAVAALAAVPAVLVPGASSAPKEREEGAFPGPFVRSTIVTPESAFPGMMLVESGRGCPGRCAFCLATSLYRPFRYLGSDDLEGILDGLDSAVSRVGLVSPAVAANPEFGAIVSMLRRRGIGAATSSLRAENIDEETARIIGESGTTSVSLAPESGSERVRYLLGKRVPNELYFNVAARLSEAGVSRFTLYLLMGCPGEDERTLPATRTFMENFKRAIGGRGFSVHVNALVPKALTPLQFYAMPSEKSLESTGRRMASMLRGLGLRPSVKSPRSAVRQALLSLGDDRLGKAIALHIERGRSWRRALEEAGVDEAFPHAPKGPATPLPWDGTCDPARKNALAKRFEAIAGVGPDGPDSDGG